MKETIYKQDAVDALKAAYWDKNIQSAKDDPCVVDAMTNWAIRQIKALPSIPQEPLSDAYARAVLTWLIDYQIKAAELKGRYTPYEVLSWVINDWRKENEN